MIPVGSQWVLPTENPGWLVKRQEDICFLVNKTRKRHTHTQKNNNKNTLKTEEKEKQTKPNKQRKQQTNKNSRIILLSILTNLSLKTTL